MCHLTILPFCDNVAGCEKGFRGLARVRRGWGFGIICKLCGVRKNPTFQKHLKYLHQLRIR